MTTIIANNQTVNQTGITIVHGTTSGGKPCLGILTNKRLSLEDFKALMGDIKQAEGFGFTKYFVEHKASLITAVKIDESLLLALANSYVWAEPVAKAPKAPKPVKGVTESKSLTKALTTKQTKKNTKETEPLTVVPSDQLTEFNAFLAFKKSLGA